MAFKSGKLSKITPFVTVFLVIMAGIYWMLQTQETRVMIPFSSMAPMIEQQNGKQVELTEKADGTVYLTTIDGKYVSHVPPESNMVDKLIENYNVSYEYKDNGHYSNWIILGVLFSLAGGAFYLQRKGKGGVGAMNNMQNSVSKARPLPTISFDDIGGLSSEMKEEILQTVAILKEPERAAKIGIKPPKGVLLYGPPGTGKTLLAQAIAKELGASFFSTSGSAFNELFVGVGASRVRSLFKQARKQSPAVIFIDEVDALAGKRKAHGGEESEKTLTELLVQLDGGHANDGILFIAATNRKDMLDDAFLRPGRIDFTFHVSLPDRKGRREIIDIHTKNKNLGVGIRESLDELAASTSGFSGAELGSLFETASRRAIRDGRDCIDKSDIDYALDRTILGSTSRSLQDPETKRRVAIHEAGHAIVAALTRPGSVRKATIIPRGDALGYVAPVPKEMHLSTRSEMLQQVAMILAGGVAERLYLGEHSIGVSGDVKQARHIIEQMIDTGMVQDGFTLTFTQKDREERMQQLFHEALQQAENLIKTHEEQFNNLVNALHRKETLEGWEVEELVGKRKDQLLEQELVLA